MKSLHEEVRQRRVADAAAVECVTFQPGGAALVIHQWQGDVWVMPWPQWVGARLDETGGKGRLEVSFATLRVLVTGENLASLVDELAAQRVGVLRDFPATYRARMGNGTAFIARIDVRSVDGTAVPKIQETT